MFYVKRVNIDKTMCIVDTEDNSHDDCKVGEIVDFTKSGINIVGIEIIGRTVNTKYQSMFNIGGTIFAIKHETNSLLKFTEGVHVVKQNIGVPTFATHVIAGKFDIDEKTKQVEVIQALPLKNGQYLLNFGEIYTDKDEVTRLKCTAYLYNDALGYIKKLVSTKFNPFPKCVYPSLVQTNSGEVYFGKKILELSNNNSCIG